MPIKLSGSTLILRSLTAKDLTSLRAQANDKSINKFTTLPHPYSKKHAQEFIKRAQANLKSKRAYELAIVLDNQIAGMMSLLNIDWVNKNARIGYWVGAQFRHHHVAHEALHLILDHAFKELKLMRITATVMPHNMGSIRLLERHGFVREGRMRKVLLKEGEFIDGYLYSLMANEFKSQV